MSFRTLWVYFYLLQEGEGFLKLIEIKFRPSGRRTIRYMIPNLGEVCKRAFLKCYGICQQKIKVLLQKMDTSSVCGEPDKRGKHNNNPRKLLPEVGRQVIDYITSHEANESHYRRLRTNRQ